ncbi:MAG: BatA domain-containing protein [Thermoguttaceae bacterium]|nr:BatA domain-containing protein [Thermoguttaceae bacterium]MDW8077518.1 BatA domain-containing protein [Thermoguttaceae bacterium]
MRGFSGVVLAMGFLQPWLLAWLVTAAIPVIIHLWSRHRCRQVPWAAMDFLLAALQARRRRILLEEWFLLFLRMLIFVLVALAAAQPFFGRTAPPGGAVEPVHRILLIDSSLSMQARRDGGSSFEKAKESLRALLREGYSKDTVSIGVFSSTIRWIIREPIAASANLSAQLADVVPTHGAADIPGVLAQLTNYLRELADRDTRPARREVWILTDLQAASWWPPDSELQQKLRNQLRSLLGTIPVYIVDVGPSDRANVAVAAVTVSVSPVLAGDTAEMVVRIAGFGLPSPRLVQVSLQLNQDTLAKQTLTVGPDSEATLRLLHRFFSEGDHVIEARLVDNTDALATDDRLRTVVHVHPALRVLCIDGRPRGDPFGGPTGYLAMALNPGGPSSLRGTILVDKKPVSSLGEFETPAPDVIVLCDVAELSPAEAEFLGRFVRQGGGLILFLGESTQADSYNALVPQEDQNGESLMPARLVRPVTNDPQFRLDPLGYRHPLLAAFRDYERAGLVNIPVEKYWALEVLPQHGGVTALSLGNGWPFIAEKTLGLGRVIVVASPPDPAWTLLPKWPSFVPLVHEMVRFATKGKFPPRSTVLGACFEAFFPPEKSGTVYLVRSPTGQEEAVRIQEESGWATLRFCPQETAGIYRVADAEGNELLYAALSPPEESDLRAITPEEFTQALGNPQGLYVLPVGEAPRSPPTLAGQALHDLSQQLLYMLICLVALESIVAYRLTRRGL